MRYYDQGSSHGFSFNSNETYAWAHKPGAAWPCSMLSDKQLYVSFNKRNGDLEDIKQGRYGTSDIDSHELDAFLKDTIGTSHPDSTYIPPSKAKRVYKRLYVLCLDTGKRIVVRRASAPTAKNEHEVEGYIASHAIGPFRTRAAADICASGATVGVLRTVAQYERAAKECKKAVSEFEQEVSI